MGGVRGVKSGGPPPGNRRVDVPPSSALIEESGDSISGRALPDIDNPLLDLFDLKPKITATDQSAGP